MTIPATDTFAVFGTTAVLLVTEPAALARARAIADAELAAVDLACSRFRPDSELSSLNKSGGELTPVSELFAALIAEALRAAELTDGDVDPTCGQALAAAGYDRDFGEIRAGGKTFAVTGRRRSRLAQRLARRQRARRPAGPRHAARSRLDRQGLGVGPLRRPDRRHAGLRRPDRPRRRHRRRRERRPRAAGGSESPTITPPARTPTARR